MGVPRECAPCWSNCVNRDNPQFGNQQQPTPYRPSAQQWNKYHDRARTWVGLKYGKYLILPYCDKLGFYRKY